MRNWCLYSVTLVILLGGSTVGKRIEDFSYPAISNDSLYYINNGDVLVVVNVATLKDLTVKLQCSHT